MARRSPRSRHRTARRPQRRTGFRPRRLPRPRASGRALALLGLLLLLAVFPPTRAALGRVSAVVRNAIAASRAADAREREIAAYARRYGIPRDLADDIERAARAERVETELAFRLVRVESAFRERAVSSAGALGLTQMMPATAAELQPGISRDELMRRDTNLRLGFRYLNHLLRAYGGDRDEALHAYNRGPGTVQRIRSAGGDPANGYADMVLGERGRSPVNIAPRDTTAPPANPLHELGPAKLR
ncbi:MAG TPA: transglycosylase SLT domain-containing protein [Longimicrobium sp.]|nr:transglycosylase SLT domain-containing protein [Longimicrobium sp.]